MGNVIKTLAIIILTAALLVPVAITTLVIGNIAMFAALNVVVVAIAATVIYTDFETV